MDVSCTVKPFSLRGGSLISRSLSSLMSDANREETGESKSLGREKILKEITNKIGGVFHSTKNWSLSFRRFSFANGKKISGWLHWNGNFSKISKKRRRPCEVSPIFEIFFFPRKFPFQSIFLLEPPEFSVEWFTFRKIQQFFQFNPSLVTKTALAESGGILSIKTLSCAGNSRYSVKNELLKQCNTSQRSLLLYLKRS